MFLKLIYLIEDLLDRFNIKSGKTRYILQAKDKAIIELQTLARKSTSSAYTLNGDNMADGINVGINVVEHVFSCYNFHNGRSLQEQCKDLESLLREAADDSADYDNQGFASGAIIDVAIAISELIDWYDDDDEVYWPR